MLTKLSSAGLTIVLLLAGVRSVAAQVPPEALLIGAGVGLTIWAAETIDKTPPLPGPTAKRAADAASWVTALTPVALDARASWQCQDQRRCFELQGARTGTVYAVVFLAKHFIHRDRPCAPACGIDKPDTSFFSGHTAIAFSTIGGHSLAITVPLATATGALRVGAGKHFVTDTIAGALVGLAASRIR